MPRLKIYVEPQTQADIVKEIKREYGTYLSRAQVCEYLGVGKNSPIVNDIPGYRLTPSRIKYRAADIAAFMVQRRARAADLQA